MSISNNEEDLNASSIVLRLDFMDNSFLFTGDATSENEKEMLSKNVQVDVLKVGHHGSKGSTSDKFLNKVNPKFAVISVAEKNDYGHPHQKVLEKLEKMDIKVYRTDVNGTIIMESNGKNISVKCVKTDTDGN